MLFQVGPANVQSQELCRLTLLFSIQDFLRIHHIFCNAVSPIHSNISEQSWCSLWFHLAFMLAAARLECC